MDDPLYDHQFDALSSLKAARDRDKVSSDADANAKSPGGRASNQKPSAPSGVGLRRFAFGVLCTVSSVFIMNGVRSLPRREPATRIVSAPLRPASSVVLSRRTESKVRPPIAIKAVPTLLPTLKSSPGAPIVVPALHEEPPALKVAVSEQDLKRLRNEFRSTSVLRLDVILEGVRRACATDEWQRSGWRNFQLEFALDEMIYRIKRAVERPDFKLPVRFGELRAGLAENGKDVLTASRGVKQRGAARCIFLVDGDVELIEASDCLILATGRINVQYGKGNVILAGGSVEGGEWMYPLVGATPLSLRISGTSLSIRHSSNVIVSAPEGVTASSLRDAIFLNSPFRVVSYLNGCSEFGAYGLDFWVRRPSEVPIEIDAQDLASAKPDGVPQPVAHRAVSRGRSKRAN